MPEVLRFGPFTRCVSAVEPHVAPPETMANGQNMLVDPVAGGAFKRNGCVVAGNGTFNTDTLNASTKRATNGIMESAPNWVPYRLRSFFSPSLADGASQGSPVPSILYGKEASSTLWPSEDGGIFGQEYVMRPDGNYNLLKEYGSTAYPTTAASLGSQLYYKVVPWWYESGEGGYSRGAFEFARRFVASGSWGTVDAGRWRYYPNEHATPLRWDGGTNAASNDITSSVRVWPTGPWPPLWVPTVTANGATGSGTPTQAAPWTGLTTFYLSVIFQFEDGSYSLPAKPVLATVGAASNCYTSLTYGSIPIGPDGTIARILVRSPGTVRASGTAAVDADMSDLRILGVLRNNTQTSYTDTLADDDGLLQDTDVVRWDLICPPRARHIGTGDQRVIAGYTRQNPSAIMLTCMGITSDYDQNAYGDSSSGLAGSSAALYRLFNNGTAANSFLELGVASTAGTLATTTQFTFNTYTTLQSLVDAINATTSGGASDQWKAQIAPGADPNASTMDLCPTYWNVSNCTASGTTLTTGTSRGFEPIPVGYKCYAAAGMTPGTYVTYVSSSTPASNALVLSQTSTSSGTVVTFYADCGDLPWAANEASAADQFGWIRVFAHQVPGYIAFKRTALVNYDKPNKDRIYFTISSPGAAATGMSVAANAWGASNRRDGVDDPGQVMGIVDVEGGAVIAYRNRIGLFINLRGANTAEDFDYRILTINGTQGCISPWGVVGVNGCAVYPTQTGIKATDKSRREIMLSDDIYNAARIKGDLAYEVPLAVQAAAKDIANCWLGGCAWGNRLVYSYRRSATTYGWSVYDFTPGADQNGLDSLANPETRKPYGWSPMCQLDSTNDEFGPRAMGAVSYDENGPALFAAINDNAGTNDGRLEYMMKPGQATDNGVNIVANFQTRRVMAGAGAGFKAKAWTVTHKVPYSAATISHIRLESGSTESTMGVSSSGSNDVAIERLQVDQRGRTRGKVAQGYWYDDTANVGGVVWYADLEMRVLRTLGG